MDERRLPAEWEDQDGVLMVWPHNDTDWASMLADVELIYEEIARQVTRFERLLVVAWDKARVHRTLDRAGVAMERVSLYEMGSNDTWARDLGPITVMEHGRPVLLDFGFNGWGLKYPAYLDNRITRRMFALGAFAGGSLETVGLILEGGSIESDGRGTLLTTARCLLDANRNPHLDRSGIESVLGKLLGTQRFLWLENGYLEGDDTDSHVDTLARFCPGDTILHVACGDPGDEHYEALAAMRGELEAFRTRDGRPYRLIALPMPSARYEVNGQRLPATYANFLILNGAVLVPTYRDAQDQAALAAVRQAFPDREVIGVDCLRLLPGRGSLHCITMQIPKGVR